MTEVNIRNGWRSPEEKPIKDVALLVVFRNRLLGSVFISQQCSGLEHAFSNIDYGVLAWQYVPVWEEKGEES